MGRGRWGSMAAFRKARAQAERDQGRPGRAHRINVLAFDADEGTLVRASLPIWLARKVEGHIDGQVLVWLR